MMMIMMIMVMQMQSLWVRALIFISQMYNIIQWLIKNAIVATVHSSSGNRVVYWNISLFITVFSQMLEFLDNWRMSALKLQVLMGKVACKIPSVNKEQSLLNHRCMIEKALLQMSSGVKCHLRFLRKSLERLKILRFAPIKLLYISIDESIFLSLFCNLLVLIYIRNRTSSIPMANSFIQAFQLPICKNRRKVIAADFRNVEFCQRTCLSASANHRMKSKILTRFCKFQSSWDFVRWHLYAAGSVSLQRHSNRKTYHAGI